ncbi:hypothetical protein BDR04DRAFT_1170034 [Suillus decipiens]|nr:hypothetical protein BDR04DRAFT_1170034 [Suillus decipiens]
MCCLQGQVSLPPFPAWPPELERAYADRTFVSKIRQYNSALAFTSVGVSIEDHALQRSGPNAFRIHGSLHHLMGSLLPPEGVQPSYAQLYIYDSEEATNIRTIRPGNEGLDLMQEKPPEEQTDLSVCIYFLPGMDGRRYNLPTASDIAAALPGDGSEEVFHERGRLWRISQLNHAYACLHYVLLFPNGEDGWGLYIDMIIPEGYSSSMWLMLGHPLNKADSTG